MGKKTKEPDYVGAAEATAQAETEAAIDQTWANRANQYSPDGSLEWSAASMIDPSTGKPVTQWSQTTTLSPELQAQYDLNNSVSENKLNVANTASGRLMDEYGNPLDWGGLSNWGSVADLEGITTDPDALRQEAEDAAYAKMMVRTDEQYDEDVAAMEQQMRNQGLNPDDRAWQNQIDALRDSYNDASNLASLSALEAGRAESALSWGQGLDIAEQDYAAQALAFDQANALRNQQAQELVTQRGFSLNELNALISGEQVAVPSFGGYNTAAQGGSADYLGAATAQGNYDAATNQSFWGGLGSLAGAGATAYAGG